MGPWEIILILALALILFMARQLLRINKPRQPGEHRFLLWAAQGFGLGKIPWAPGTFGSLGGLLWFLILLGAGSLTLFLLSTLAAIAFSVRACGFAEQMLRQKDPGSVVLDELTAMPVCFLGWVWHLNAKTGSLPPPDYFFSARTCLATVGIFVLFRLFDIAKPWPVGRSQALPRGWGITIDDVLAAGYVNLVVLLVFLAGKFF
jgi:phosphatidylglycerophosphatase A